MSKYDRIYNFAAGPSMLPLEVLEQIHSELFNFQGTGMSVMEMSHRSKAYMNVVETTKKNIREVLNVPDNYEILFIQGGATEQFSSIPLNLAKTGKADYVLTGEFSTKAYLEAKKFIDAKAVWDGKAGGFKHIPEQNELQLSSDADYLYFCSNNTIYGTEWKNYPTPRNGILVCDMSSDILSKKVDVSSFGLIYAGAQKNMGISGMAVVIVRKDLIESSKADLPILKDYYTQNQSNSMYNTPPTFSIYVCGLVVEWVKKMGGLEAIEKRNHQKADLLYSTIDGSSFYQGRAEKEARSYMNVTFNTPTKELDDLFVMEAKKRGLESLKGHRVIGGIRASIYNAMPIEGVEALIEFMHDFEKEHAINKGE